MASNFNKVKPCFTVVILHNNYQIVFRGYSVVNASHVARLQKIVNDTRQRFVTFTLFLKSHHPACIDHAKLNGKPFGIPVINGVNQPKKFRTFTSEYNFQVI